jgi:DNA-binding MarR family transcriptional regulator
VNAAAEDPAASGGAPDPDRERLLDSLMPLSRALIAIAARSLNGAEVELTIPQYRILVALATRGPQRSIDLALEQAVHPSTITRACDRLIRRGLVRRYQRPPDRRIAWLALTEAGRRLVGEVMRRRRAEFNKLITAAGVSDVAAAAEVIEALAAAAGEPSDSQWWRQWERSAVVDSNDDGPALRAGPSSARFRLAEDTRFELVRGVTPTRFPSVRPRPLGESSANKDTASPRVERHSPAEVRRMEVDLSGPPCGVHLVNLPRAGRQQG